MQRRLKRLLWLLLHLLSSKAADVVAFVTRHLPTPARRALRAHLLAPLVRFNTRAVHNWRNLPHPARSSISLATVTTVLADDVELHGTLYLPTDPQLHCKDMSPSAADLGEGARRFPSILVRTPYGRDNLGPSWARIFAQHGYACLVQDTRGRFGSGGDFFPVKHEKEDGVAAVAWMREQPWCNGKVAGFGVSYLGLTAFAAAGSPGGVDCLFPVMAGSRAHSIMYTREGALKMDLVLRWLWLAVRLMDTPHVLRFWLPLRWLQSELNDAFMGAPLHMQDEPLIGGKLEFLQQAIRAHDVDDDFWSDKDVLCDMTAPHRPPTHIVCGWHDFFAGQSFDDFRAGCGGGGGGAKSAAAAGVEGSAAACMMTVGPWKHWDVLGYGSPSLRLALDFFKKHMHDADTDVVAAGLEVGALARGVKELGPPDRGDRGELGELGDLEDPEFLEHEARVRVAFLGTSPMRWCGFQEWPPACADDMVWPLARMQAGKPAAVSEDGRLSEHQYDPADPTPYAGGPGFNPHNSGCVEQSALEARDDVLVFTAEAVRQDTYICGDVAVELSARSSNPYSDFFVKLCHFNPVKGGTSHNLAEQLHRFHPRDWDNLTGVAGESDEAGWHSISRRRLSVGPIAALIPKGHCVRLQVSGGAHPLYMRNMGSDEHFADAVQEVPALHQIFHESNLVLPIIDPNDVDAHDIPHPAFLTSFE